MVNKDIKFGEGKRIEGDHPVVIIGPNGSGKTTFANTLSKMDHSDWISATRNLQFSDSIVMQTPEESSRELMNKKNNQQQKPWTLSGELNQLLAKLKSEDAESAIAHRNKSLLDGGSIPDLTKVLNLTNKWNILFPQREIDFTSYSPKVTANHREGSPQYGISRMSGGERVALYLLARVLDAPEGKIFIDEPEIHFHAVLARRFWSEMELLRPDCRFIYITHDLPFAISRRDVQFIVVKSDSDISILEKDHTLPDDIIEPILGAATFSVSAKNIVFCEGTKENKMDFDFYSSWFSSEDYAVIPVKSCEDVISCVDVFNSNPAIKGLRAIGIIDRDYRSDRHLEDISDDIHVLVC